MRTIYRAGVYSAKGRRVGRVREVIFDEAKPLVVGYIVERPRLFMLFDRKDKHLARDRSSVESDGVVVTDERGAWDRGAEKRLGLAWDATVVWMGMPVRTKSGTKLGAVRDGLYDPATGDLEAIGLTGGTAADITLGVRDLPARFVRGYEDGFVVLDDAAAATETSGGAAAAAGKGAAVAKAHAAGAAKTAGQVARVAGQYGSAAAKAAAGSETGKKAIGWLKALRDEVADAMGEPDDDKT
jgi:uncharacterized protein YrrD